MEEEKDYINGYVVISDTDKIIVYVIFFIAYYIGIGKSLYMDDLSI
jgi:hypothetical protein